MVDGGWVRVGCLSQEGLGFSGRPFLLNSLGYLVSGPSYKLIQFMWVGYMNRATLFLFLSDFSSCLTG